MRKHVPRTISVSSCLPAEADHMSIFTESSHVLWHPVTLQMHTQTHFNASAFCVACLGLVCVDALSLQCVCMFNDLFVVLTCRGFSLWSYWQENMFECLMECMLVEWCGWCHCSITNCILDPSSATNVCESLTQSIWTASVHIVLSWLRRKGALNRCFFNYSLSVCVCVYPMGKKFSCLC